MRGAQLWALTPLLLRAVRWQPVPVAALGAALLLWWQDERLADPSYAVWSLRVVALLLAVGVAFALDDRTRLTLAAVPTPLWWRATVQLIGVAIPAVVAWGAALLWVGWRADGSMPEASLSLEAVALAWLVLAVAGGLARWRDVSEPGVVTAPAMLGVGLMLPQLPANVALTVPEGTGWDAAHIRWSALLVCAVAVLALSLRDPAATRRHSPRS